MAPISHNRRKTFGTRASARSGQPHPISNTIDVEGMSEPPKKKKKKNDGMIYKPGGPGGGGMYVKKDGTEVPVGGTGPGGPGYSGSRARVSRESTARDAPPPPSTRPRRDRTAATPRYSSAAAAAAAVAHGDGYKPREERGWEEFHPDLDVEVDLGVFFSEEVDGIVSALNSPLRLPNGTSNTQFPFPNGEAMDGQENGVGLSSLNLLRRGPGRPLRQPNSMLSGILTPDIPKIVPPPGPNPRERLTLPKPSYRLQDPYSLYEQKGVGQKNYVDRTMASVGYQESDIFLRPERRLIRVTEGALEEDLDLGPGLTSGPEANAAIGNVGVGVVEYDMDEQDEKWLEAHNAWRTEHGVTEIKPATFEITMTKIEKEWHALEKRIPKPNPKPPQTHRPRSSSAAAVNGEPAPAGEEQDSKCAICDDGDCENANAIVFCDGCDLAVHQECYGVPYIPEGQWLCRKCQLIGRGVPTCIFCPNTEGAFKQTNTSRWAHLLCAIWIPEVSLGNPSLMEPVNDVEKVPNSRWKLACYICRQKMGACIQCSNKNCYTAFHVTCARRSRLYLKMKTGHGAPATFDSNLLKANCDKHTPSEWRREHNTDQGILDAMDYYKVTMRGRRWADSQQSALAMGPSQPIEPMDEDILQATIPHASNTIGGSKRKHGPPKTIWRLLSGAPVIPQSILNSVEGSLQRFGVNKKKEYAVEACKYWTLKREARRGAALLKRLQLQMETFSSMEMTRRDFASMGAAGGLRLQRRIEFSHMLERDNKKFRALCELNMELLNLRLKDMETMKEVVDATYFPIPPMLWPILERAQILDGRNVFWDGLQQLRVKLEERYYTSVSSFSKDFASVFSSEIGVNTVGNTAELQMQIAARAPANELSLEQREKRKLAKRIIKAVQGALEDALRKESELNGKPFEKELRQLDLLLENSVLSRRDSYTGISEQGSAGSGLQLNGGDHTQPGDEIEEETKRQAADGAELTLTHKMNAQSPSKSTGQIDENAMDLDSAEANKQLHTEASFTPASPVEAGVLDHSSETPPALTNGIKPTKGAADGKIPKHLEPPTPPMSFEGETRLPPFEGGISWYMDCFDPDGLTVYEERWTGREVVRGMSEELSDMDEDEVDELVDISQLPGAGARDLGGKSAATRNGSLTNGGVKKATGGKRKRWKGLKR